MTGFPFVALSSGHPAVWVQLGCSVLLRYWRPGPTKLVALFAVPVYLAFVAVLVTAG